MAVDFNFSKELYVSKLYFQIVVSKILMDSQLSCFQCSMIEASKLWDNLIWNCLTSTRVVNVCQDLATNLGGWDTERSKVSYFEAALYPIRSFLAVQCVQYLPGFLLVQIFLRSLSWHFLRMHFHIVLAAPWDLYFSDVVLHNLYLFNVSILV